MFTNCQEGWGSRLQWLFQEQCPVAKLFSSIVNQGIVCTAAEFRTAPLLPKSEKSHHCCWSIRQPSEATYWIRKLQPCFQATDLCHFCHHLTPTKGDLAPCLPSCNSVPIQSLPGGHQVAELGTKKPRKQSSWLRFQPLDSRNGLKTHPEGPP